MQALIMSSFFWRLCSFTIIGESVFSFALFTNLWAMLMSVRSMFSFRLSLMALTTMSVVCSFWVCLGINGPLIKTVSLRSNWLTSSIGSLPWFAVG